MTFYIAKSIFGEKKGGQEMLEKELGVFDYG
jgi:hypothetical protein